MIRRRRPAAESTFSSTPATGSAALRVTDEKGSPSSGAMDPESQAGERRPLLSRDAARAEDPDNAHEKMGWARRNQWIVLAIASGACAAFNGVFAKLTTTELTTSFAQGVARLFHLDSVENVIEYIVRAIFFGLNLVFNGVMWTLFTQALAKGNSTTQVSIINTSSNFMITAMLGLMIFSESLPPLWWAGATFLVAGNVIIGSKDESGKSSSDEAGATPSGQDGLGAYEDVPQTEEILDSELKDEDEDVAQLEGLLDSELKDGDEDIV